MGGKGARFNAMRNLLCGRCASDDDSGTSGEAWPSLRGKNVLEGPVATPRIGELLLDDARTPGWAAADELPNVVDITTFDRKGAAAAAPARDDGATAVRTCSQRAMGTAR